MKPKARRIPCKGNCGRQIMKLHAPGVKSYNHTGYCRHCFKAKAHREYKLEHGRNAPGRTHRGNGTNRTGQISSRLPGEDEQVQREGNRSLYPLRNDGKNVAEDWAMRICLSLRLSFVAGIDTGGVAMNDDLSRDVIPDQPTRNELGPACLVVLGIVAVLIIIAAVLLWIAVVQYEGGLIP